MLTKAAVYADTLNPVTKLSKILYNFSLILGGSLAIALAAQAYIPLPFTPVPLSGQTLMVLLTAMLLGGKRGAASIITYIGLGITGVPLFAGGTLGFARLLGPTGGYLIGFIAAAYLVGYLAEKGWDRHIITTTLAMLIGNALIYLFGLPRLASFVGWNNVLKMGLYPFITGDIIKLIAAVLILPSGWKLLGLNKNH